MENSLGVGIIGASAERGWAKDSHVPAVQHLAGLHLAAVASGSPEKGQAAAKAFSAAAGYGSGQELIADPNVAIVAIAVKVPDHAELVRAAAKAGKHIYCEWPLGIDAAQTEELAGAASAAGVRTAIGLQLRGNPAVLQAQRLLSQGAIGRVLSANVVSPTVAFGPEVEAAMAFAEYARDGVTLLTIQAAHTVDMVEAILGPWRQANALCTTQFPDITVDGTVQRRSTTDHVLVQGRVGDGIAVGVEIAGGRPEDAPFAFDVVGTVGRLQLHGGAPRGVQSGTLELRLNGQAQQLAPVPDELPEAAINVAAIYAMLRDDILNGTSTAPGFAHAVRLAQWIEALQRSSDEGRTARL